ncbi:tetratricopeptide repeat protein [Nocardiopsis coralliicola]
MQGSAYDTFTIGRSYFDIGNPIAAARVLEPLAEEEPESTSVLELLGRAYFHSAQLRKAEGAFRRLTELDPCDSWARIALARALERQGRADEAATQRRMHAAMSGGSLD